MISTAILLSAGYGSRLKPLSDLLPKCLMPVGGRVPVLGFWINRLEEAGVERIFINTHYLGDLVEDYVTQLRSRVSADLILTHETTLLGSMGSIRSIVTNYGISEAVVLHCDNYTGFDLAEILEPRLGYPVAIVGFYSPTSDLVGRLVVDENSRQIVDWIEKDPAAGPGWASNAIYSFDKYALAHIVKAEGFDLINEWLIPQCVRGGCWPACIIYNHDGNIDIGTEAALRAAQRSVCSFDYQTYIPRLNTNGWAKNFFEISLELES